MSIEVALADAANAIRQLTAEIAVLNGRTKAGAIQPGGVTHVTPPRDTSEDTRALTADEKKAIENAKSQKADDAAREALQKARDASKAPAALSYETHIKGWLLGLVKKNRQAALDLYTKYGVKIGAELKPEQLPAFKVDLDAALAANGVTEPAKIEAKK